MIGWPVDLASVKRLNDHLKDKGDEITESGLRDLFPWFVDAVDACSI